MAGVYLAANSICKSTNRNVTICDVTNKDMEPYLDMMKRAYGYDSIEYLRYMNIVPEAERVLKRRNYIAFSGDSKEPIGYATTGYLKNDEVLLMLGAAVLKEHRGQGVYSELLRYRIEQGIQDGTYHFISHASKTSSYNSFKRFGFDDISDIQIYEWSPY